MLPQHLVDRAEALMSGEIDPDASAVRRGEDIFTGQAADYPRTLVDFIGQEPLKEQLAVEIASARSRGARLEHTLFEAGAGGIGKTTLAHILAAVFDVGFVSTTAPLTPEEFVRLIQPMDDRDIVFVDEIHRQTEGGRNKADWLLSWMLGDGLKTSMGMARNLPDVTLIAATTEAGKLPDTVVGRFMSTPEFSDYTPQEAALIVGNNAERMKVDLAPEHWHAVARAADRNPRAIRKILTKIRDLQHAAPGSHPNLERALRYAGFSEDGLTTIARHILLVLAAKPSRTAAIDTIRQELGEPGSLRRHEQILRQHGLIEVVGQGRKLTPEGVRRATIEVS